MATSFSTPAYAAYGAANAYPDPAANPCAYPYPTTQPGTWDAATAAVGIIWAQQALMWAHQAQQVRAATMARLMANHSLAELTKSLYGPANANMSQSEMALAPRPNSVNPAIPTQPEPAASASMPMQQVFGGGLPRLSPVMLPRVGPRPQTNTDGRRLDAHPTAADPHSGKRAVGAHAPHPVAQIITEADGTSARVAKKARTHDAAEEFALREADAVRGLLLIAALR